MPCQRGNPLWEGPGRPRWPWGGASGVEFWDQILGDRASSSLKRRASFHSHPLGPRAPCRPQIGQVSALPRRLGFTGGPGPGPRPISTEAPRNTDRKKGGEGVEKGPETFIFSGLQRPFHMQDASHLPGAAERPGDCLQRVTFRRPPYSFSNNRPPTFSCWVLKVVFLRFLSCGWYFS